MANDLPHLLAMSRNELDALFSASPSGDIPEGEAAGTLIVAPGFRHNATIATFVNLVAWKGKRFDAARSTVCNNVSAFGLNAVVARVYKAESWLDRKECIVLDYSKTSFIAAAIRDELRLIGRGLYLGQAYWARERLVDFALQF
jgi:hypothetical protein